MIYKGYQADVTLDEQAGIFHGEVLNTRDVITFQGRSVEELTAALRDSVEDYFDFCRQRGEAPEKPYSGKLALRISPELHRALSVEARRRHQSLNAFISEKLTTRL